MIRIVLSILCQLVTMSLCLAQTPLPQPTEGDVIVRNFRFQSNDVLPELRLHYRTHTIAKVWKNYRAELLKSSESR